MKKSRANWLVQEVVIDGHFIFGPNSSDILARKATIEAISKRAPQHAAA